MPSVPAICDVCQAVFPSGMKLVGEGRIVMTGSKAGPCPRCGGRGVIPDGIYAWADDLMTVVSGWSPAQRQAISEAIREATKAPDPQTAVAEVIMDDPDLQSVASKLILPRDAGQFWAVVAVILEILLHFGA